VYAREIEGQEYTFGVSGKLIRNVLVMYDRQTESLWSQLLGEAVDGPMIGTKLTFLPSWMMTWEEWRTRYPETLALDKNGRRGSRDVYDSYYVSGAAGVIGETLDDDRLPTKAFVIGVEVGDATKAYDFASLSEQPVVNDEVGGVPVLVWFDTSYNTGVAYSRVVDGQTLTFEPTDDPQLIQDVETGSVWDAFQGVAVEGALSGKVLPRVKSTRSFWFGWKDLHPDTAVFGQE